MKSKHHEQINLSTDIPITIFNICAKRDKT
jgi:hypothetical protein